MKPAVKNAIICVLLFLAVAFIVYGIIEGDYSSVLNKAKMICYECIGIG